MAVNYLLIFFWALVITVAYTFFGYGILLYVLVCIKRIFAKGDNFPNDFNPQITILIAAYNEEGCIRNKIENTLKLDYPADNKKIIIISDGSTDHTNPIVQEYPGIKHLYQEERKGKIDAVKRAMKYVETEFVVFTDANTELNVDALKKITRHFRFEIVGAVAGEKRILSRDKDIASASGEGIYWKYESKLKQWDSEFHSVVGAAGELFAIRTQLFENIPDDTLIEDFYLTLKIAQKGYKVVYEPHAYALEEPSVSAIEELKRKIRIAAGGLQAISRLLPLLNFFKYRWLSLQYISHRVLRWTLAPLALPIIFFLNASLAFTIGSFYTFLFLGQVMFYVLAVFGFLFEKRAIKIKLFFIPFYFCLMNYAVYAGFIRLIRGTQTVLWERAKRRTG